MAIEKVIEINVKGKEAEKSLNKITQELFEQKQITLEFERELKKLEQQLRDTPNNALGAQRHLRQEINHLKDAITDQKLSMQELNVERQKTAAIQRATQGEQQFTKALTATRGEAQALNMLIPGLGTRVGGLRGMFNLATGGVQNFVKGLGAMKAAIIATGIGALVVAIGAIVAYWDEIVGFITQAEKIQQRYIDNLKAQNQLHSNQIRLLDKQIELAEENGESVEELVNKKHEILLAQREINNALILALEAELESEKSADKKAGLLDTMVFHLKGMVSTQWQYQHIADKVVESTQRQAEIQERINNLKVSNIDIDLSILRINREKNKEKRKELDLDKLLENQRKKELAERLRVLQEIEVLENQYFQLQLDRQTQEENAVRDKYFRLIELAKQYGEDITILEEAQQAEIQAIRDRVEEERLEAFEQFREQFQEEQELSLEQQRENAIAELELLKTTEEEKRQALLEINEFYDRLELERARILEQQKVALIKQTLGAVAEIMGKNSAMGKAAASAQALINTYQGITEVLSSQSILPEPFATIQKVASIGAVSAIGFKAVKDINKTKTPGGGSGSMAGGSPERSQAAFNLVGDRGGVRSINQDINQEQAPVKAYVVSREMTTQQELDNNAVNAASF